MSVPHQELKDLAAQLKDVSVTVGMDSRCHIDLSGEGKLGVALESLQGRRDLT